MTRPSKPTAANLAEAMGDLKRQTWREQAACNASTDDFVDVPAATGEELIATYCARCPVLPECRAEGDRLAPHSWSSVYGGRRYGKGERVVPDHQNREDEDVEDGAA